jgi:tetratricopeptide (TPR) repeat protein
VTYGPDGRTLASVGSDHTVALWDTDTSQVVWTLRVESALIRAVAFSPDGRTLASASDNGAVKLWDAATGQELLTLRGHAGSVSWVAFSPDGRTLATAGADGTVKLWDATPMTPAARASREARIVVQSLFDASLPAAEVLAHIRRDATLGAATRQRALALAESYARSRVVHEADRLVESLYAQGMLRPEVLARLHRDAALSEAVRSQALALAELVAENPESLAEASRVVVLQPDAEPAAYRLALEQAEAACRLIPDEADFLKILGVARYRVGRYREAVAALTQADRLHRDYWIGLSHPVDLAFLALARHRLGQTDQARALLGRLRETMKSPQWARAGEAQSFLREAEEIELELAFPADPFAPGP